MGNPVNATLQLESTEIELLQYIVDNYCTKISGWWNPEDARVYETLTKKIKEMKPSKTTT